MFTLNEKKIILIMPKFFGYEDDIILDLENRGAEVKWIRDRPLDNPFCLLMTRLFPSIMILITSYIFKKRINDINFLNVDYVIAISPLTLSINSAALLKAKFPFAKYILYLWDSVDNRKNLKYIFSYFERKMSFDPECCKKYGLIYRPLFYRSTNSGKKIFKYDISFIGTIHSDRYSFLKKIKADLSRKYETFFYFYIHAWWLYYIYKIINIHFRRVPKGEFSFSPLNKKTVDSVFSLSKVIVDIQHPRQRGLTMRTLEALGSNKKLITTNEKVVEHDFYNPSNIYVVDRYNPVVPESFIEGAYLNLPDKLYHKYSLSGWLDEFFL